MAKGKMDNFDESLIIKALPAYDADKRFEQAMDFYHRQICGALGLSPELLQERKENNNEQ